MEKFINFTTLMLKMDYLLPLKALDEKIHEGYDYLARALEKKNIRRGTAGLTLDFATSFLLYATSDIAIQKEVNSLIFSENNLENILQTAGVTSSLISLGFDSLHSIFYNVKENENGLQGTEAGERIAEKPVTIEGYVTLILGKFLKVARLPHFVAGVYFAYNFAFSIYDHFTEGSAINGILGIGAVYCLLLASSMYIKDLDVQKAAKDKIKDKIGKYKHLLGSVFKRSEPNIERIPVEA